MNEDNVRYFYKYCPFTKKNRIEHVILENKLYFPSPNTFNDPFDCKTLLSLKNSSNDDWLNFLRPISKRMFPAYSDDRMKQFFKRHVNFISSGIQDKSS